MSQTVVEDAGRKPSRRGARWRSMTVQVLAATVLGIVVGTLLGPSAANLKFIGDIFIRLIQMSVVLLVMSSVISAMAELKGQTAGKMGLNTFKWVLTFTVASALTGLALATLVQPGTGMRAAGAAPVTPPESMGLQETLLGFVSKNIVGSMANADMIPVIVFALLFGIALNRQQSSPGAKLVVSLVKGLQESVLRLIHIVMKVAPIGIFALLANVAGAIGFGVIVPMAKYLLVHAVGVLLLWIVFAGFTAVRCGVNPLRMPGKFARMTMIALTTTSSAITFPTAMEDTVEKFGVSRRVADFTLPIGLTMNSCGAALSNVVVILFLAQAAGMSLGLGKILLGLGLAVMLCMGTITVPGGFAVAATFLATSLGLPPEAVALMIGVDWFAGMARTFLNVSADTLVSMLVANAEGDLDRGVYNAA